MENTKLTIALITESGVEVSTEDTNYSRIEFKDNAKFNKPSGYWGNIVGCHILYEDDNIYRRYTLKYPIVLDKDTPAMRVSGLIPYFELNVNPDSYDKIYN